MERSGWDLRLQYNGGSDDRFMEHCEQAMPAVLDKTFGHVLPRRTEKACMANSLPIAKCQEK